MDISFHMKKCGIVVKKISGVKLLSYEKIEHLILIKVLETIFNVIFDS